MTRRSLINSRASATLQSRISRQPIEISICGKLHCKGRLILYLLSVFSNLNTQFYFFIKISIIIKNNVYTQAQSVRLWLEHPSEENFFESLVNVIVMSVVRIFFQKEMIADIEALNGMDCNCLKVLVFEGSAKLYAIIAAILLFQ